MREDKNLGRVGFKPTINLSWVELDHLSGPNIWNFKFRQFQFFSDPLTGTKKKIHFYQSIGIHFGAVSEMVEINVFGSSQKSPDAVDSRRHVQGIAEGLKHLKKYKETK